MSDSAGDTQAIAEKLRALSASVVADALEGRGAVLSPALRRFSGAGVAAGRAITADCAPGSLMAVFPTLEQARPGDMLCMSAPGPSAYMGDLLAANLAERKLSGAIVDGLIRDVSTIAKMPLTVFARGVTPLARRGREPGVSMQPIKWGDVEICPGDWIIADNDGVVIIEQRHVGDVLAKASELARMEERIAARIRDGMTVAEAVRLEGVARNNTGDEN